MKFEFRKRSNDRNLSASLSFGREKKFFVFSDFYWDFHSFELYFAFPFRFDSQYIGTELNIHIAFFSLRLGWGWSRY
jgi:hypothetical protein